MERLRCSIGGCNNVRMSKGTNSRGIKRYRQVCSTHHKLKSGRCPEGMSTIKCSICGWDGPCDRHRIVFGMNGGRYKTGNITILCPNCHRLLHLGRLKLK